MGREHPPDGRVCGGELLVGQYVEPNPLGQWAAPSSNPATLQSSKSLPRRVKDGRSSGRRVTASAKEAGIKA